MKSKKVLLLLNGEVPHAFPAVDGYDLVCATDGAYWTLKKHDITPDFINGDLDSLKESPENIEIIHTPDQDYTDFDKILDILFNKGYNCIDVFGASGKEQDHFLGNLHTAVHWRNKLDLVFFDNHGYYFLATPYTKIEMSKGKTISLVPMHEAKGVKTTGLQYPLKNETLIFGQRIGTRNKAISNLVEIHFKKGNLFIFVND
ncbi:thiamine diphosphokinase [Tamlana fucoidanivorans]|uniref:Thiamine diphosphokinase n=1 Tax=Allotamlana fucoidanivorans TaxID=2583814 RepID=A0A5C4SKU3_9FLAO|nr:thiamine diphosphokinase [Tamlana fucoidanivorans]TNJ44554.1 thiamine diphosphokinase [Tamlana fucoidanivorans]